MPKHGFPDDHWRFVPEDMSRSFADMHVFESLEDPGLPGVFLHAVKWPEWPPTLDYQGVDLSAIEVASVG